MISIRYFIIRLDGKSRLQLTESKIFGIFRTSKTSHNYLSRLYMNSKDQRKLQEIVHREFGWEPYLKKDSKNLINIVLQQHPSGKSLPITKFGDGIRCFIGICLSVLSCPFRIVLLDEPEAFLHPPTAYSLGKNLSKWVEERYRSLIISTHSSEFLLGCLQSLPHPEMSIIRLTYQNNIGTVTQLNSDEILRYAKDPLLRSSDILNALFHNSAVVTEGDDDKVIYQEANS